MDKNVVPFYACSILVVLIGCRQPERVQVLSVRKTDQQPAESVLQTKPVGSPEDPVTERSEIPKAIDTGAAAAMRRPPATLGRTGYGQDLTIVYDGIPMGCNFSEIVGYLDKIPGVQRGKDGAPFFERVRTKTYYHYIVDRQMDGGTDQSEVDLFFKNNALIQMKDVFGGAYTTEEETKRRFQNLMAGLEKTWGTTEYRSKDRATWVRGDVTAVLRMELPTDSIALPIITLLIWRQ